MAKHNKRDATVGEYVDAIPDGGANEATIANTLGLTVDRAHKSLVMMVGFGILRRNGDLFHKSKDFT